MPKNFKFDWSLPEAVFGEDLSEKELWRRVQEGVVISLFKEGRVSSGLAAEMLAISKRDFLQLLYDKGVPYFDLTEEELQREFSSVDRLEQELAAQKE